MPRRWLPFILVATLVAVAPARAEDPALSVSVDGRRTAFSAADLAQFPHQSVKAFDKHENAEHTYSGVAVSSLLAKAGVLFGEKLRGRGLRKAVLVHCRDHYDIVFALAEFDADFNSRTILLADAVDGHPLPEGQGPLRFVVPGDARPARWARMVRALEVVSVGPDDPQR